MFKLAKNQLIPVLAVSIIVSAVVGATAGALIVQTPYFSGFISERFGLRQVQQDGESVVRTVEESAVIDVVEKTSSAVVSIVAETASLDPGEGVQRGQQGIGTGFIVRSDGVILTASHVVSDNTITYKIVTGDEKTFTVKSVDIDPSIDFAILKIDAKGLPTLKLADSDNVKVGQKVVAIGNALGRFTNSVTVGVISGVGRGVTPSSSAGILQGTLENVIQTDAALNPGNSGGPLIDLSGNVVGINFATTVGAENIGFVIPINQVKPVLTQYFEEGRIIRPFLGVGYSIVSETASLFGNLPQGVYVQRVVGGSPAAKAGLKPGDIITKFGEFELTGNNTLATVIGKFKVGEAVEMQVWRDGKMIKLKATLVEAPS